MTKRHKIINYEKTLNELQESIGQEEIKNNRRYKCNKCQEIFTLQSWQKYCACCGEKIKNEN